MKSRRLQLALTLLAAIVTGCTTTGTGAGSTASGGSRTTFSWMSSDGVSGTMTATTSDGQTYRGLYFQITKDTTVDSIGPLWSPSWGGRGGWGGRVGWGGWGYWDADPTSDFITHYTGRVLANLAALNGTQMRCQFQLVHPSDGMNGGGAGQCQLRDGTTIDTNFPAA
jgi:hypothetical protein